MPIEPDLVVRLPRNDDEVILHDPDGVEVPLIERPSEQPLLLCRYQPLRFLTTASALLPNTTYTVIFRRTGAETPDLLARRSFTTGELNTAAVDPAPIELRSYGLSLGACGGTFSVCGDYVELELGETAFETQQPFWLRLTASRDGTETSTVLGSGSAWRALLPVDTEQPCIDYERFDARGQRVESRQLCQRDKCAVSHPDCIFSGLPGDGCVGPGPLGRDAWELVGADSCDAPPRLSRGCVTRDEFVVEPNPDAGAEGTSAPDSGADSEIASGDAGDTQPRADAGSSAERADGAPGCAVGAPRGARNLPGLLYVLALMLPRSIRVRRGRSP